MIRLTRRYGFSAAHRLHAPHLSEEANRQLYGKCNNPYGHGHNYVLEVTVRGEVDPKTGRVVDVGKLDAWVRERILEDFDHRDFNRDVPEFSELIPTTENIVRVIGRRLCHGWRERFGALQLHRIRVEETAKNFFELRQV
jgi:6-pyruvoyltetrahydropterin/6-carboxytetrahydropterin synthase